MKKYVVSVPVLCFQSVLVEAADADDAKTKVMGGQILDELGPPQYQEICEGTWTIRSDATPIKVDLKWSLWSADKETWEERAPSVWSQLEEMTPGDSSTIESAPRKEIRYGSVTIERTSEGWTAHGWFDDRWDEIPSLREVLNIPEEEEGLLAELLPYAGEGEPGIRVDVDVRADTLEELMKEVDEVENELLSRADLAWRGLEESFAKPSQ